MARRQRNNTMVRFPEDIDILIRKLVERKNKTRRGTTITSLITGYVIEGIANDDDIHIDENGNYHLVLA